MKTLIQQDLISAMKAKDTVKLETLRSIIAAFTNEDKSKGNKRTEIEIISSLAKQRQQSIDLYKEAGKDDLMAREMSELEILETYLPSKLSEDEIKNIVKDMISEIGEFDQRKMGMVIGKFNKEYPGQDGKLVANIVKSFI